MEVKYHVKKEDYTIFLKRLHFQKDLGKRLFILIFFSLLIGGSRTNGQQFELSRFIIRTLITGVILFSIVFLIPYLISRFRLYKALLTKNTTEEKKITI